MAQVVLGNAARGDNFFGGFLNISVGYGLALMVGICISGGVSGGHLNPAVTLAMAAVRKLHPRQVTRGQHGDHGGHCGLGGHGGHGDHGDHGDLGDHGDHGDMMCGAGTCLYGWAVCWGFPGCSGAVGRIC